METTQYAIRITMLQEMLGSVPLDAEIYSTYIASKAPVAAQVNGNAAAEVDTIEAHEALDMKGRTGFHRNQRGEPMILDYVVKGFLKEAWQNMRLVPGSESAKLKAGKSRIDGLVFVEPRYIVLHLPTGGVESINERPLRAETPRGPRVALAASEQLPIGTWFDVRLTVLAPHIITETLLKELFAYGQYSGMGQWRSGGMGKFSTGPLKPYRSNGTA